MAILSTNVHKRLGDYSFWESIKYNLFLLQIHEIKSDLVKGYDIYSKKILLVTNIFTFQPLFLQIVSAINLCEMMIFCFNAWLYTHAFFTTMSPNVIKWEPFARSSLFFLSSRAHSFKTPNTTATANNDAFWKDDEEKLSLNSFQRKRLAMKNPCPLFDPILTLHIKRNRSIPSSFTRPLMSSDRLIQSQRHLWES